MDVFLIILFNYLIIEKYSAIGPRVSTGKKAKPATNAITANTIKPKVAVSVFNVPLLSGMYFYLLKYQLWLQVQ